MHYYNPIGDSECMVSFYETCCLKEYFNDSITISRILNVVIFL